MDFIQYFGAYSLLQLNGPMFLLKQLPSKILQQQILLMHLHIHDQNLISLKYQKLWQHNKNGPSYNNRWLLIVKFRMTRRMFPY